MSREESSPNYTEIVESGFWQDPTDGAFTEAYFGEVYSEYISAIRRGDSAMWELSNKLKLIGKFLPLDDERNPDNQLYNREGGQQR